MPLPQIVMEGRLVDDPELRFTQGGKPVVNIRVVANNRVKDDTVPGGWKDGESVFLTCSAWDQMAENIAESLPKGALVTLSGRLKQREYETKEGEKRTVYEIALDAIGPSLRWDRAQVARKVKREGGEAGPPADPWATIPHAPLPAGEPAQPQPTSPLPGWGGAPPDQPPQYDNPPF